MILNSSFEQQEKFFTTRNCSKIYLCLCIKDIELKDKNWKNIPNFPSSIDILWHDSQLNMAGSLKKHFVSPEFISWIKLIFIFNPGKFTLYQYNSSRGWMNFATVNLKNINRAIKGIRC